MDMNYIESCFFNVTVHDLEVIKFAEFFEFFQAELLFPCILGSEEKAIDSSLNIILDKIIGNCSNDRQSMVYVFRIQLQVFQDFPTCQLMKRRKRAENSLDNRCMGRHFFARSLANSTCLP